jgi:hypothetical protein
VKWTRHLEKFLEIGIAVWLIDIFFRRTASSQKGHPERKWARPREWGPATHLEFPEDRG